MSISFHERCGNAERSREDHLHDTISHLHDELADARFKIGKLKMQLATRTFVARQFLHNINDGLVTASNEDPFVAMYGRDVERWETWDRDGIA